tara:strand:+ start:331 stop:1059 length:729 start_codon:yes stop_codon:yes gene_type:complete
MTTGLTYSTYKTQIATLAVVAETDTAFITILPQMITYAENRIYRDLDFLFTSTSVTGYSLTAGLRSLTIPEGTLVVSEQINILTPAGQTNPDGGSVTRNGCLPTTKEFLDAVYGSNTSANRAMPRYFVPFNDNLFLFGPVPDAAYGVEIIGTYRPASLSSSNTETFISKYLPDVFIMASMIYVSGYQRNFGRANDDVQMAVTYESQYQTLLKGAAVEEARKKFQASAWSSQGPAPIATPSRG